MSEISKRITTSIFLIFCLIVAIYNKIILFLILCFIFTQILYEIHILLKKIFYQNKLKNYLVLFLFNIYTSLFIFINWLIFSSNDFENKIYLIFIISICISTDIGGYIFGKLFKGKKLTKISPRKTYSGMYGSFLLSLLLPYFFFNKYFEFEEYLFLVIVISLISQIGDLFFSYIKRKAKIKDTGNFLPGHGGILDRLDGIIFAIPFGLLIIISI